MRWFGIFCHFCCLLLLHTVPWLGCWGDTAAAPPLSQPLLSCWGVYPLSTKKSHSMTTDKHVPVHLPQMFIGTHKKTFCFCILKIVTFTSSKVQNKCNFNQNPFKNSIKKIHQKSALFLIEMYYKSNTLWEGGYLPSFVKRCDAWAAILYSGSPTLFTNKASSTCQRKKYLVWEKITFLQCTVYTCTFKKDIILKYHEGTTMVLMYLC